MSEKCDPDHYSVGEKAKICCKNHRSMTVEMPFLPTRNLLQANTRQKFSPLRRVIKKINRDLRENKHISSH